MVNMRRAYKTLAGKPEGKSAPGRCRYTWEDNINIYIEETGCDDVDWIHLVQDRDQRWFLVNTEISLYVLLLERLRDY
jgi:hypothetical protein